jgi:uncharacterized membrane protein
MSKADRIKEEIGWLKVVFAVCDAVDASLVAWLAQNYATANRVLVISAFVSAVVLAIVIAFINRRASGESANWRMRNGMVRRCRTCRASRVARVDRR